MALVNCSECGQQVSTEANACPHCGKPQVPLNAAHQQGNYFGAVRTLFKALLLLPGLFFAVIALISIYHWNQNDTSELPTAPASATIHSSVMPESSAPVFGSALPTVTSAASGAKPPPNPKLICTAHYTDCKDNADLVNKYGKIGEIQAACEFATNDHVRYGNPDWPWLPFDSFFDGNDDVRMGVVRLLEPNVQIQNGFGAMVHSRVVCDYDLRTSTVVLLDINGEPIRLGSDALLEPTNQAGPQPNAPSSAAYSSQPAPADMQATAGVPSPPASIASSVTSSAAQ